MDDGLLKVSPDREKARSIIKMVGNTLEMIETIDAERFPSNVVKEYYDAIRELLTALLLLDGYKTQGEGAHKKLIEYTAQNYNKIFSGYEVSLLDDLRTLRNKIAYDGFFVKTDYLPRHKPAILDIIDKLLSLARHKLSDE